MRHDRRQPALPLIRAAARALAALALALGLLAAASPPGAAEGEGLVLGLAQSREFARRALLAGQVQLARSVALALLEADPRDPAALVILAAAETRLGAPARGARAARLAFRSASGRGPEARMLRHDAARVAAEAAEAQGRPTVAQVWLRHAATAAPEPALRADAEALHRAVRARNPFQGSFRLHLAPTTNVNRGSRHDTLIVGGIETPFVLSGDARALSGLEIGVSGAAGWRIAAGEGWSLEAGGRLAHITYRLSAEARRLAPDARGGDFAQTQAEGGLRLHLRPGQGAGPATVGLTAGRAWYGGDPLARSLRLDIGKTFALTPATALRVDLLTERQWRDGPGDREAGVHAVQAHLIHRRPSGDVLRFRLTGVDVASDDRNAAHRAVTGEARIELARPLGPLRVSLSVTAGWRDYPVFMNGVFGAGREETSFGGAVEMLFPGAEVWGFAPAVTLRGGRTQSNVSRFDSEQVGLEVAVRSTF
jgi:hypothetical protein